MIDFDERLRKLKDLRRGTREQNITEKIAADSSTFNYRNKILKSENHALEGYDESKESYELLKQSSGIKYTIGAMDAVRREYTDISIKEGNRVADSLVSSLINHDIYTIKKLQGSVALDIHIKGYSDVDMLVIIGNPVTTEKPLVNPTNYSPATDTRPMVEIIRELRIKSEQILPNNFPRVDVNIKGSKSIALEGGSLTRKVDVVPSCWYDTRSYQASKQEHERGIRVYDKDGHELLLNYPFKHIKAVNDKDARYSGNLKCVIRLVKHIIHFLPEKEKKIAKKLSSYDLAAIAYHMNEELKLPFYMRLGLVEKTRAHLEYLRQHPDYRNSLDVPDDTRKIFNDNDKTKALNILTEATEELAQSIFQELKPYAPYYQPSVILEKMVI